METDKKQYTKEVLLMSLLKLLHIAVSVASFAAVWVCFYSGRVEGQLRRNADCVIAVVYTAAVLLLFRTYRVYEIDYARTADTVFGQALSDLLAAAVVYSVASFLAGVALNPLQLIALCAVQTLWNALWSKIAGRAYSRLFPRRRAVVVYGCREDLTRVGELRGLKRCFSVEAQIEASADDFSALASRLRDYDAVIVSGVSASLRNDIARYCVENDVHGYFAPHVDDIILRGARHLSGIRVPVFSVRRACPSPYYLFVKRCLDVLLAAAAVLLLSPLFLCIAVAVKLCDRGPVFYRQTRLTIGGREFKMLKFRSMRVDAERDGVARLACAHDDRITPVGSVLRACRLDELPQLFNVLCGDMSLVGPRPERPEIAARYAREVPSFPLRLQVKAGLTGFAQVYGRYNTTPGDKLQMDLMYVNQMSFSEDARLLIATLRVLLTPDSTEGVGEERTPAAACRPLPRNGGAPGWKP